MVIGRLLLVLAVAVPLSSTDDVAAAPTGAYYVDPVGGVDAPLPQGTSKDRPWKTVSWASARIRAAHPDSQAGVELNLRSGVLHPPTVFDRLKGTAEQPFVIQPYGGSTITFDGSEPALRQPGAWVPVPGRPYEWVSRDVFSTAPNDRIALGRMLDTRHLLIAYAELADLRAENQSFARVPLSDPRPALGPVLDRNGNPTAHKIPFVYLGPGTHFEWLNSAHTSGRIHLRLAPTRFDTPGIVDYPGGTDPFNVAITRNSGRAALFGGLEHVTVRNAVFQNGGRSTLVVDATARSVTFDHCQVYGTRFGATVNGTDIRFTNCTFDGGLGPWTTRTDVKSSYHYAGPPDCPKDPDNGRCFNGLGAHSHDILVISQADGARYLNCTFRHAHDAIEISGENVDIAHSLFEDVNDEVVQFNDVLTNARVHENVFRQVMHPYSLTVLDFDRTAGQPQSPGPIYFYRNVVDQRVPTRGFRTLVPDAPEPFTWRYGAELKGPELDQGRDPTPELHVYQNTVVSSHSEDKGSFVGLTFAGMTGASKPRSYNNNIHLVLNLDRTLLPAPDLPQAVAAGNIWHKFHPRTEPFFNAPTYQGDEKYWTLDELHHDFPDWERDSQHADPLLTNFSDEFFEHQVELPNTDYRPRAGGPADGAGVPLDPSWPDPFRPADGSRPDVGARPVDAPVLVVGVDGEVELPAAGTPVADAGGDQTVADSNGDGFEDVSVTGAASGDITAWIWMLKGRVVSTSRNPTLTLPEGEHNLRLVVRDSAGLTDSDALLVRVVAPSPGENHLDCPGFEPRAKPCSWQVVGSGGVVTQNPHSGATAFRMTADGSSQQVRQRVAVSPGAGYTVSGWLRTQSLTPVWLTLTARVLNQQGEEVQPPIQIGRTRGNSAYTYHQAELTIPAGAAQIELIGELPAEPGTGQAFLDDIRVRDRNRLRNGGFEQDSPAGGPFGVENPPPEWEVRGFEVVEDPALVHSGRRALALVPGAPSRLANQKISHRTGDRYRVSAWVMTDGPNDRPNLRVVFYDLRGRQLGSAPTGAMTSPGRYMFVSTQITTLPPGTAGLAIDLQYAGGNPPPTGRIYLDDVLVQPV